MHFDQRTQRALREVAGLSTADIEAVSEAVVRETREEADGLEAFFEDLKVVYSDMDRAHSASDYPEHTVEYLDLFTHAADIRGYLRFDTWGVPVVDGRVLTDDVVELTLGPTVDGRVRFARERSHLQ